MRVFILAHYNNQMRRRCPRNIHEQWARAPQIPVILVKGQPIDRGPIVTGVTAKDRTRLKTNQCFATTPDPSRVVSIACSRKSISAITRNPANAPYPAAESAGSPCCYTGWIIDRYSEQPAMIQVTVPYASISDI